jgi:hypothetical protein
MGNTDRLEPIRKAFRDRGHYGLAGNDSLCADLMAAGQPQPRTDLRERVARALAKTSGTEGWEPFLPDADAVLSELKAELAPQATQPQPQASPQAASVACPAPEVRAEDVAAIDDYWGGHAPGQFDSKAHHAWLRVRKTIPIKEQP